LLIFGRWLADGGACCHDPQSLFQPQLLDLPVLGWWIHDPGAPPALAGIRPRRVGMTVPLSTGCSSAVLSWEGGKEGGQEGCLRTTVLHSLIYQFFLDGRVIEYEP
jgi:hypothetical protein